MQKAATSSKHPAYASDNKIGYEFLSEYVCVDVRPEIKYIKEVKYLDI